LALKSWGARTQNPPERKGNYLNAQQPWRAIGSVRSLSLCVKRGAAAAFFCAFRTVAHLNLRFQSATSSESRSKYHLQAEFRAASLVCVRRGHYLLADSFVYLWTLWSMRKGSERPLRLSNQMAFAKVDLDKVGDLCLRMVRKFQGAKAHLAFVLMDFAFSSSYWALI
jgi:hypothetical protein